MSRFILCLVGVLFAGCTPEAPREVSQVTVAAPQLEGARFTVTIVAEFSCDLAYGGKRRIYEISDSKTGRVYLSVTGLGMDRMREDEDNQEAADAALDAVGYALDSMGD
jgi:hypothetical protein